MFPGPSHLHDVFSGFFCFKLGPEALRFKSHSSILHKLLIVRLTGLFGDLNVTLSLLKEGQRISLFKGYINGIENARIEKGERLTANAKPFTNDCPGCICPLHVCLQPSACIILRASKNTVCGTHESVLVGCTAKVSDQKSTNIL